MRYVKWGLIGFVVLFLGSFLHYTLPRTDIVRIVDTDTRRMDFGLNSIFFSNAGGGTDATQTTRDVKFVETVRANGKPLVLRNEDTGWGWPPYFKFSSYDLQTEAANLRSSAEAPRWVAVRYYGWRDNFFTVFPNVTSMRAVAGPDVRIIPWFKIVFFLVLAVAIASLWRLWRNFRRRRIDPVLQDVDEAWDETVAGVGAGAASAQRRARTFGGRWRARFKGWFG